MSSSTTTSAISASEYARRCKALMALHKDLRALGASGYFKLPNITVIGGQSAGKSSLVEAVSGITVPRDSGTCTRCPMECNMSSSATSWSCQISLRFDYDSHGHPIESTEAAITFGGVILDKREVGLWIRRAQAAILNPHVAHTSFYTRTDEQLRHPPDDEAPLEFSKNTVVVDVNDPDITDLSFIDLPEDIQTQRAALIAHNADANGERTIGVLTKPDTLTAGQLGLRAAWKNVLERRVSEHLLHHGYYVVRLLDNTDKRNNVTRAAAEARALECFDSTEPWSSIYDRTRFGVDNLIKYLARLFRSVTWELPTYVPFAATQELVGRFTKGWRAPSLECFNQVVAVVQLFLEHMAADRFSQFSHLHEFIRGTISIARRRDYSRNQAETQEYAEELTLMSKVRAYWQIAYQVWMASSKHATLPLTQLLQRVIDYIPQLIEHEFNQRLAKGLQTLFEQLVGEEGDVAISIAPSHDRDAA
ncbi:hypothetical protein MKEN_00173600 [Mycena kentingensis (nom. inval.)]|nr:hypothetical protein MKEN_00173600 [Mycena kentingensis (nom. inval.)]